jgi:phosphoribosylformylglycinamidine synthase
MLLVAKKGCEDEVLAICKKWDLDAAIVGRVTDTKRWVVLATPGYDPLDGKPPIGEKKVAADLPVGVLTDDAPVYDRPREPAPVRADVPVPESTDPAKDLLALLASPNVGSKAWIWRQYDHIVRGGTVVRPGSDAGVVRVPCERDGKTVMKHLAFAVDCNGRFVELAPEEGAKMAIAEVCRNLVCAGAEPIGITDCLNFASPENPGTMDQLARAIDGLAEGCRALDVPIVSGNVSLYNETSDGRGRNPILPTPTVAAVGLVHDGRDVLVQTFRGEGDVVILLGEGLGDGLGGSEYQSLRAGKLGGPAPRIDLEAEKKLQRLVLDLARARLLASAHDAADGGLAVALVECCDPSKAIGAEVTLSAPPSSSTPIAAALFGEAPSRIVVSTSAANAGEVTARAAAAGVPATTIGKTTRDGALRVAVSVPGAGRTARLDVRLADARNARESCLAPIVGD